MKRPYVICHILSALNGRISGPFMGTAAALPAAGAYGSLRAELESEAWLYGTTTTKEFTGFQKPDLMEGAEASGARPAAEEDFVAAHEEKFYYVSIDTRGEIGWESSKMKRGGKTAHVIEVLTGDTPEAYRAYLRRNGISYIQAGDHELDCRAALEKLYQLFGIHRLLICGGGQADWTFLDQGMMDELSLVLAPAADGSRGPSVFDSCEESESGRAAQFQLKEVKQLEGGVLWLRYQVKGDS